MAAFEEILQTIRSRGQNAAASAEAARARRSQNWQDTIGRVQGALEGGINRYTESEEARKQREHEAGLQAAQITSTEGMEANRLKLDQLELWYGNPLFLEGDAWEEYIDRYEELLIGEYGPESPQVRAALAIENQKHKNREELLDKEIQAQLDALRETNQHELAVQLEDFVGRQGLLAQEHRQAAAILAVQHGFDIELLDAEAEKEIERLREQFGLEEAMQKVLMKRQALLEKQNLGGTYLDVQLALQEAGVKGEKQIIRLSDRLQKARDADDREQELELQRLQGIIDMDLKRAPSTVIHISEDEESREDALDRMWGNFISLNEGKWKEIQLGEKLTQEDRSFFITQWEKLIVTQDPETREWLQDHFVSVIDMYSEAPKKEDPNDIDNTTPVTANGGYGAKFTSGQLATIWMRTGTIPKSVADQYDAATLRSKVASGELDKDGVLYYFQHGEFPPEWGITIPDPMVMDADEVLDYARRVLGMSNELKSKWNVTVPDSLSPRLAAAQLPNSSGDVMDDLRSILYGVKSQLDKLE